MFASRVHISGGRILNVLAITVAVLLVCAGVMRACDFTCSPKRSPRAVIETTVKEGQEAGSKKHALVAICQSAFMLDLPNCVESVIQQGITKSNLIEPGRFNARAPPFPIA